MAHRTRSVVFRREWLAPPGATPARAPRPIPIHPCEPPLVWVASVLAAFVAGLVLAGAARGEPVGSTALLVLLYGAVFTRGYGADALRVWGAACGVACAVGGFAEIVLA